MPGGCWGPLGFLLRNTVFTVLPQSLVSSRRWQRMVFTVNMYGVASHSLKRCENHDKPEGWPGRAAQASSSWSLPGPGTKDMSPVSTTRQAAGSSHSVGRGASAKDS